MPPPPPFSPGPEGADGIVSLEWLEDGISSPPIAGFGNFARLFNFGGTGPLRPRYYEFRLPAGYVPGTPLPVILLLHGGNGYAAGMRHLTLLDTLADAANVILVYCGGTGTEGLLNGKLYWNMGKRMGNPLQGVVDDIGFLRYVILTDLQNWVSINLSKVIVAGFSNGAMMAYRCAAEMADILAGVAAVAGNHATFDLPVKPTKSISLLTCGGTKDLVHPYRGGPSAVISGAFFPFDLVNQAAVQESWLQNLSRSQQTSHGGLNYHAPVKQPQVIAGEAVIDEWICSASSGNRRLKHCRVNGGHSWPGGQTSSFSEASGFAELTNDIIFSELLLDFTSKVSLVTTS